MPNRNIRADETRPGDIVLCPEDRQKFKVAKVIPHGLAIELISVRNRRYWFRGWDELIKLESWYGGSKA